MAKQEEEKVVRVENVDWEKVVSLANEKGFTMQDLSNILQRYPGYISHMVRSNGAPADADMKTICTVLKVTLEELLLPEPEPFEATEAFEEGFLEGAFHGDAAKQTRILESIEDAQKAQVKKVDAIEQNVKWMTECIRVHRNDTVECFAQMRDAVSEMMKEFHAIREMLEEIVTSPEKSEEPKAASEPAPSAALKKVPEAKKPKAKPETVVVKREVKLESESGDDVMKRIEEEQIGKASVILNRMYDDSPDKKVVQDDYLQEASNKGVSRINATKAHKELGFTTEPMGGENKNKYYLVKAS